MKILTFFMNFKTTCTRVMQSVYGKSKTILNSVNRLRHPVHLAFSKGNINYAKELLRLQLFSYASFASTAS